METSVLCNKSGRIVKKPNVIFTREGGRYSRGIDAWLRRSEWPARWPLKILPSLGFTQPACNIRWSHSNQRWQKYTDYIT